MDADGDMERKNEWMKLRLFDEVNIILLEMNVNSIGGILKITAVF